MSSGGDTSSSPPVKRKRYNRIIQNCDSDDEDRITSSSSSDTVPMIMPAVGASLHDRTTQILSPPAGYDSFPDSVAPDVITLDSTSAEEDEDTGNDRTDYGNGDDEGKVDLDSSNNGSSNNSEKENRKVPDWSGSEDDSNHFGKGSAHDGKENGDYSHKDFRSGSVHTGKLLDDADSDIDSGKAATEESRTTAVTSSGDEVEVPSEVDSTQEGDQSSSGSESVSGAENDLDDEVPLQVPNMDGRDSLDDIEYPDDQVYYGVEVNVEEKIHSFTEFSLEIYRLGVQEGRKHYVSRAFVDRLRELDIQISFRRYDPDTHLFLFQMNVGIYESVMNILNELNIKPQELHLKNGRSIRAVKALSRYYNVNIRDRMLNSQLVDFFQDFPKLRQYQREVVEFAVNRSGRCMLADEGGMGKRVEAIATASFYKKEWPLLIVCAASHIVDWRDELLKQGVSRSNISLLLTPEDCERLNVEDEFPPTVVVVGYTTLQTREATDGLKAFDFKVLILDECHRIKHTTTQTAQMVRHLTKRAKRRLLLTANPAYGVPRELFRQLHVLDRTAFQDYVDFAEQYCGGFEDLGSGRGLQVSRSWKSAKNLPELRQILFGTVVIRHFRSDYHTLPKIHRQMIQLEFLPDERTKRLLGSVSFSESQRENFDLEYCSSKKGSTKIFKWFKRSGIAKLIEIVKYLDTIDFNQSKVIIYARHRKVINGIEQLLRAKRVRQVTLRGDLEYEARQDLSDQFNSNSKIRVALISLDVSNVCINLSSASLVIFAELFWVPDRLFRNESRSYNLTDADENEQREIEVKYLMAGGLSCAGENLHIDSVLWDMLSGKMDILHQLGLIRREDVFTDTIQQTHFQAKKSDVAADLLFSDMSSSDGGDSADEYQPSSNELDEESDTEDEGADSDELNDDIDNSSDNSAGEKPGSHKEGNKSTCDVATENCSEGDDGSVRNAEGDSEISATEEQAGPSVQRRVHTRSQGTVELPEQSSCDDSSLTSRSEQDEENSPLPRRQNRTEALGSSDTDDDRYEDELGDSEGSLRDFVVKSSGSAEASEEESEEDEDYVPKKKNNKKKAKKRSPRRKQEPRSVRERTPESSDDSEEFEQKVKKTAKNFFL